MPNPTGRGGWKKGQSGNPGGQGRKAAEVFGNLAVEARKYSKMALGNLVYLAQKARNESVRLQACVAILDRGYGRPTQSIDLKTDGAPNVQVNFFDGLGLDDPGRFESDLAKVIELKAEREKELSTLARPSATTLDIEPEVAPEPQTAKEDADDREDAP
jgi:hypothetical protein